MAWNRPPLRVVAAIMARSSRRMASGPGGTKRPACQSAYRLVPGSSIRLSAPTYSGSMAVSTRPVASAWTSERSSPAMPSSTVSDSGRPASRTLRPAAIISAASAPLCMAASVASSPLSNPM